MTDLKHGDECLADDVTLSVCEGMYGDKCTALERMREIVRAIYALCGEHPEAQQLMAAAEKIR